MTGYATKIGVRKRERMRDDLLAKQVSSQLSYTPTVGTSIDLRAFAAVLKLQNIFFPSTVSELRQNPNHQRLALPELSAFR